MDAAPAFAASALGGVRALWCAGLLAAALAPIAGAQPAADALAALDAPTVVQRTLTLSDLGISAPIVLRGEDRHRDLYLPVPPGIPIRDASIRLSADYRLPDAAATRLLLSLDNDAVSARTFATRQGDASAELGVDGSPRAGGFVHLGVDWAPAAAGARCPARAALHNALRIDPGTRLSYHYDSAAIRDLPAAWNALPLAPVLLTGSRALSAASYDSAWRVGAALARAGRHPVVRALPQPGEQVDLAGIQVPSGLLAIPAFAALAHGGRHTIGDAAEVGALLALGTAGPLQADLLLADPALQRHVAAAVNALRAQAERAGAGTAFAEWEKRNGGALAPADPHEIRLAVLAGRPAIVLGAGAGAAAAAQFDAARRAVAKPGSRPGAPPLVALDNGAPALALPLTQLGGYGGSIEVAEHAEWQLEFDIARAGHMRAPAEVVIDIAAARHPQAPRPTASVLLNDILLGSQRLDDDGKAQRLTVTVPRYVPLQNNTLRLVFQRPAGERDCNAAARGAAVTVLPTSHIVFRKTAPADDFIGMSSRFASGANLIVPRSYLDDAPGSLPRVSYIAAALGVAPGTARLQVGRAHSLGAPRPFLSFEPQAAPGELRTADAAHALLAGYGARRAAAPGAGVGMLKLTRAGEQRGIVFRRLGDQAPQLNRPFVLAHGAVALLAGDDVLAELDADGSAFARMQAAAPSDRWRGALWLLLPCAAVLLFIGLLVVASHVRRRKERAAALHKESA